MYKTEQVPQVAGTGPRVPQENDVPGRQEGSEAETCQGPQGSLPQDPPEIWQEEDQMRNQSFCTYNAISLFLFSYFLMAFCNI